MNAEAARYGVTALVAAGAFPGMSNVLAMEAAAFACRSNCSSSRNRDDNDESDNKDEEDGAEIRVRDLYFQYFTAGLGGSGTVNLYITNVGFGDPVVQYRGGALRRYDDLSGRLLGAVNYGAVLQGGADADGADAVSRRVGRRQVFAWPFPEAATVARELGIAGDSAVGMGTAPDVWNAMLGLLVDAVPRPWWRNPSFCRFVADFSQPLVQLSDAFLRWTDRGGCGETHAMRIDVVSTTTSSITAAAAAGTTTTEAAAGGSRTDGSGGKEDCATISIVQAHDSFRQCVGQSCAEFVLDCLYYDDPSSPNGGVWLPEQRYRDDEPRRRIIERLTSTPGAFCYTGPVEVERVAAGPTNLQQVLERYCR